MGSDAGGNDTAGSGCRVMQTALALEGGGTSIAEARHRATEFLSQAQEGHGLPVSQQVLELTQLVVSELVTNARKYAPGPVLMELRLTAHAVDIVVWDSDPTLPAARDADPGRIGQHGLEIVQAVTENLSVAPEPVGKRITARIALQEETDSPGRGPL
ncbi:ATP-binding protein [Streptomyces chartreusis]|uniref:ATP-binding protein n=1 Tax=Streptomyces chartreusis TaxID=1969 RepID=UPI003F4D53EC